MKKPEVSDFWLWFSNSRMLGTASYSSLEPPLMDANDNTNSGVVPVLKAETGKKGRTSPAYAFYLAVF